jgi:ADP-dependent NAD(P)H-hydrate dehydratase / NAD(P)H-hydrate epimerase
VTNLVSASSAGPIMLPAATAAESLAIERYLIDTVGFPSEILMEAAGRAVAAQIVARWPAARRIVIVCGPGNNGGDGFVCSRALTALGLAPTVIATSALARYTGVAAKFAALAHHLNPRLIVDDGAHAPSEVSRQLLAEADVVVDGLFGTGCRPLTGRWAEWVQAMNLSPAARIAIDIASGLCATTGQILGVAVQADVTVAMITYKLGALTAPGCDSSGATVLATLDIPEAQVAGRTAAGAITLRWALAMLPQGNPRAHKGVRGHVVVVGGAVAGMCTWLPPPINSNADRLRGVDAPDPIMVAVTASMVEFDREVETCLGRRGAMVLGPGLGRGAVGAAIVQRVLSGCVQQNYPLVIDADALVHLEQTNSPMPEGVVLTPHPAEAARLLGSTVQEVQRDRVAAARALAIRYRAVIVLKGQRTIICDGMRLAVCLTGAESLATAGTGDVLAGLIGALRAQGLSAWDAAAVATAAHGAAGELLEKTWGHRGAVSSDVPDAIATVLAQRDAL